MFAADPGERQVVFFWSPPPVTQRNGVITSYTLSCFPSLSSPPQSPSQSGPLTVTGFSPDTAYTCSVVATNSQGSGPPASITFTTQQDCKSGSISESWYTLYVGMRRTRLSLLKASQLSN